MLQVIAELQIEEDDQHLYQLRVVDQMGGPQQLLPQLTQFQPADTPERLEAFIARLHAYPAYMAANVEILRDGLAVRPDRAAHRRRADDRPDRADARDPDRVGHRAVDGQGRDRGGPRARPRHRPRRRLPGRPRVPRGAQRRLPRRDPRGPGPVVGARRRGALPDGDPQLDDARPRPRGRSTRSASTSSSRSRRERREIARGAGLRRRHGGLPGGARRRPGEHARDEGRARRPRDRGHRAGHGGRAALLRRPAAGRAARSGRSRSTRRRTRRSPTTTRRRPDGSRPGIYYANGYDLPSRKYTQARHDDLPRGGPRPPLPDHPRDGEPAPQHVPAPRARGWSAAPTSRAGACTASGWPTRWACSATRRERFGMLDAQAWRAGAARRRHRAARPALAAPALDRLPAGRPACPRRTRSSRPTATSAGRARP